ncbi:hypothetical protein V8G54_005925 [Vigna mungo]|uniref:DOG1 domain-containing protein n=1 Tax=Vigna mungo TaxID=3915 RepID=A0AAQ3S6U9_VIGMU
MAMHPENSGSEKKILVEVEHTTNGAGTPGGTEENQTGEGQVETGRTIAENRPDEFRTDLGDDTDGIMPEENVQKSFEAFYEEWLARHGNFLQQLLSVAPNDNDAEQRMLIEQVMCHYQQFLEEKSNVANDDIFLLFSPPWLSAYERGRKWSESRTTPSELRERFPRQWLPFKRAWRVRACWRSSEWLTARKLSSKRRFRDSRKRLRRFQRKARASRVDDEEGGGDLKPDADSAVIDGDDALSDARKEERFASRRDCVFSGVQFSIPVVGIPVVGVDLDVAGVNAAGNTNNGFWEVRNGTANGTADVVSPQCQKATADRFAVDLVWGCRGETQFKLRIGSNAFHIAVCENHISYCVLSCKLLLLSTGFSDQYVLNVSDERGDEGGCGVLVQACPRREAEHLLSLSRSIRDELRLQL